MKYTIFSIDNSREQYTAAIERYLLGKGWTYLSTEKVNGSHTPSLEANIEKHGYEINWIDDRLRVGHLGIWYTVLNSFELAPHVTFEDDAILNPNFDLIWKMTKLWIPKDTDFFSLFLPRDSDHMWNDSMNVNSRVTRVYQRYGGVSMYYTEQGVEKIRALLKRDGLRDQYDNTLYSYAKSGELNGYCQVPTLPDLVYITGEEESIVQESNLYAR